MVDTNSNKLKVRFMVSKKDCHVNIELAHWDRLKEYWSKPKIKKKVEQMSNARSKMKNMANVGRTGKARKEAKLVLAQTKLPSIELD